MFNCKTIDIESALYDYLSALGYRVYALPVPEELDSDCVIVQRTGGSERAYVQDVHQVAFDCYGDTKAAAMQLADTLTREVRAIVGKLGGVAVYESSVMTLPYDNPDPSHYTLERATFSAQIVTRVKHV